jgi:hypothetical protein
VINDCSIDRDISKVLSFDNLCLTFQCGTETFALDREHDLKQDTWIRTLDSSR